MGSVIYPGQTPRIYWNYANTQTGNIDTTYANGPSFAKYDAVGTSINLDWQVADNLKFKSITGWRQINWNIGTDLDGTTGGLSKRSPTASTSIKSLRNSSSTARPSTIA